MEQKRFFKNGSETGGAVDKGRERKRLRRTSKEGEKRPPVIAKKKGWSKSLNPFTVLEQEET